MTKDEIVTALRCCAGTWTGCGDCTLYERDRCLSDMKTAAADLIENQQRELERIRAQLDCATACADRIHRQNQELRDAAALATKLAADVAPVVRCRDCEHMEEMMGGPICTFGVCVDCVVPEEFYCAYGKRKDGGAREREERET